MVTTFAVTTGIAILAVIGLLVGLVILGVVVTMLQAVYAPIRSIKRDAEAAATAPMLDRGIQGLDALGRTRQLANTVPGLAGAYLQKLNGGAPAAAPRAAAASDPGDVYSGGGGWISGGKP
jgi:hypothetical protein